MHITTLKYGHHRLTLYNNVSTMFFSFCGNDSVTLLHPCETNVGKYCVVAIHVFFDTIDPQSLVKSQIGLLPYQCLFHFPQKYINSPCTKIASPTNTKVITANAFMIMNILFGRK